LDEAEASHRESLRIAYDVQSPQDIADSLAALGRFLLEHQRDTRGKGCQMLQDVAALYELMGVPGAEQARETARRLGCPN
jgi:hypothetical protein